MLKNRHSFRFLEIVFLVCFLLGIVAANLYGKGRLEQYGIINTCFIQQLKYVHVSKIDFLIYIISIRIPVIFLLLVLGMTSLYRIVHGAFLAWTGFAFGFLCVAAISNLGIGAVLLILGFLFPHYLFYGASYLITVHVQWRYHEAYAGKKIIEWIIVWSIILMLFLIGMITEAYINPLFYPLLLKYY